MAEEFHIPDVSSINMGLEDGGQVNGEGLYGVFSRGNPSDESLIAHINDSFSIGDVSETTLLLTAVRKKDPITVARLIKAAADVNLRGEKDQATPLHRAVAAGDSSIIEMLMEANANPRLKNEAEDTPLIAAIRERRQTSLNALLRYSSVIASLDAEDQFQNTALHLAAKGGDLSTVKQLVEAKANLHALNEVGDTPLMFALDAGDEIAAFLLERGAKANWRNVYSFTPLHFAAQRGKLAIVEALLRKGAEIRAEDFTGYTPLQYAMDNGHHEVVRCLQKAASLPVIDKPGKDGQTLLHHAAKKNNGKRVRELLAAKATVNPRDDSGATPLIAAAVLGSQDAVKLLLKHAAEQIPPLDIVNETDLVGISALHYAAQVGGIIRDPSVSQAPYSQIVEDLLAAKAHINSVDGAGHTPLLVAAYHDDVDVVATLLAAGADVNYLSGKLTPLIVAARARELGVVTLLLAKNATVDLQNSLGETALYAAVDSRDVYVVEALCNAGADPRRPNNAGITPYELAESGKMTDILKLFSAKSAPNEASKPEPVVTKHGKKKAPAVVGALPVEAAKPPSPEPLVSAGKDISDENFLKQVKANDLDEIDALLEARADIEARDSGGNTALMVAILNGKEIAATSLLEHKASPNAMNNRQQSPLHLAALKASCLMETLLYANEVNAKDADGQTPLMLAAKSSQASLTDVEKIMAANAQPQLTNNHGERALDLAQASNIRAYLQQHTPAAAASNKKRESKKPAAAQKQPRVDKPGKATSAQNHASSTTKGRTVPLRPSASGTHASSASSRQLTAAPAPSAMTVYRVKPKPVVRSDAKVSIAHKDQPNIYAAELGSFSSFPPLPAVDKAAAPAVALSQPVSAPKEVPKAKVTATIAAVPKAAGSGEKSPEQKAATASKAAVSVPVEKTLASPAPDSTVILAANKPTASEPIGQPPQVVASPLASSPAVASPVAPAADPPRPVSSDSEPSVSAPTAVTAVAGSLPPLVPYNAPPAKVHSNREVKRSAPHGLSRELPQRPASSTEISFDSYAPNYSLALDSIERESIKQWVATTIGTSRGKWKAKSSGIFQRAAENDDSSNLSQKDVLFTAIIENNCKTVQYYIDFAVELEPVGKMFWGIWEGLPLVQHSMLNSAWDVTELLLVNAQRLHLPLGYRDMNGRTALTLAMWLWRSDIGNMKIIESLIAMSQTFGLIPDDQTNALFSLVNLSDKDGMTPLMLAGKMERRIFPQAWFLSHSGPTISSRG